MSNSSAMERPLKKVYECLNMGCHKKAVQEVDRLPKNIRDLTVFKALKSLAFIRMNKRRQAFDILNEINLEDDLDEVTLQTMTSCYKESVDVGKIVDLYEAASRRKPNDPEVMAHLFMAHARVFNFKRQKEIAMQMYKISENKRRLSFFWAIVSLVMQSQEAKKSCSQETIDRKVCLSLAEKMCEKVINEDERTHEEIELYLIILRKQNKFEEEYRFLTEKISTRITDHLSWFTRRRAYLCLDLKMYSRAFKHYFPTLIVEYPDQIEYYQGLFKSAFLLDTEAPCQQQPVAIHDQQTQNPSQSTGTPVKSTSALAESYDIVEKQCALTLENLEPAKDHHKGKNQSTSKNLSRISSLNPNRRRLLRGPFMARIELFYTISSNADSLPVNVFNSCMSQFASKFPTLVSLLLDYFKTFSRKILCYYDLDYMMSQFKVSEMDKMSLLKQIGEWVINLKQNQPDMGEFDAFHVVLNYEMWKHSLHKYKISDSKEQRLEMAKKYINHYDENRHLAKTANKTEFLPVDNYCLLAVNCIMSNSVDLNNLTSQSILSDSVIVSLIVLMENAIANSPSNHQLKLSLLKLYSFIGASKQCSEVLLSLDIKHFQIDTLGHLLNPVLYNTGNYTLSRESLEKCLDFYSHGVRECFEGLTSSYRDGRFSKIEEISSVLKRLCDSLNATQCVLLKGIVANLNAATVDELNTACQSFDPFKGLNRMFRHPDCGDVIRDNRDFKVLKSLNAEVNELIQDRRLQTMEDEQLWLKLRYYLIKSVYLQLEYVTNQCTTQQEKSEHSAELAYGRGVVESIMPKIQEAAKNSNDRRYSYFEPESSPFRWSHIKFERLIDLVCPIIFLHSATELTASIQENYNSNLDAIINELEDRLSLTTSLVELKQTLLSLTVTVEFISLVVTSLVSLAHTTAISTSNISNQQSPGNPNKPSSSQQPQLPPASKLKSIPHQLTNKTEAQLTKLSNLIKNVDVKVLILDKITSLEEQLLSDKKQVKIDNKGSSVFIPLMGQEAVQSIFGRVKEKLVDSFNESLKEIEITCRRKIKLLRVRLMDL